MRKGSKGVEGVNDKSKEGCVLLLSARVWEGIEAW